MNITPTFNHQFESSIAVKSAAETEDADFERDDAEPLPKLTLFSTFKSQLKSMSASIKEIKEKQNTLSDQDGSILKKWIRRLAEKLKDANNEIERIKFERKQEQINFQYKLDDANRKIEKLKFINTELSKKMINAISAIKMSWFNFELNHEETDALISQLQLENKSLRKWLKIQNQHNCKKEVEDILKSEELLIRNKENYMRSRSMQFHNTSFQQFKKEDTQLKRKGKKSQGEYY